jgi:probable phosphoglycerate mutase
VETARIAFDGRNLDARLLPGLRERNLGAWEGRLWKEVAESVPEEALIYKKEPAFRPPGGESWHELQARMTAALQQILSAHPGGRIAVFTSGGSLRAAVFGAMSIPAELWSTWATWNTGLSRIDHRDGSWRLVKYNDVGHLSGTGDGRAVF